MSEVETVLGLAVERAYEVFESEPQPQTLRASPHRDAEEILRMLTAEPLRRLTAEQLGPYAGWAMTTVGDERAYRHFLPRIFELAVTDPVWVGTEPAVMAMKLHIARWRAWTQEQQAAVRDFFHAAFAAAVVSNPEDGQSAEDWLCGLVHLGEPALLALTQWLASPSPHAALQLASFILNEASHLRSEQTLGGSWWTEADAVARHEVATMLLSDAVQNLLQTAASQDAAPHGDNLPERALAELVRRATK